MYIPVAPVIGTAPLRFTPPLKYDHVSVIALRPTGVMTYALGDKSCALRGNPSKVRKQPSNSWRADLTISCDCTLLFDALVWGNCLL